MDSKPRLCFVDVNQPSQVKCEIDLDNVVLSDAQKWRLTKQALKTSTFWQLYLMQALSICKCPSSSWPPSPGRLPGRA